MDTYESRRRRKGRARTRYEARRKRDGNMAVRVDEDSTISRHVDLSQIAVPDFVETAWQRLSVVLQDILWHTRNNPLVLRSAVGVVLVLVAGYFVLSLFSGNIMPRVRSMGIDLGGLSEAEAEARLMDAWNEEIDVTLIVNGQAYNTVRPETMGIRFDAASTARQADSARLSALPFGKPIAPILEFDRLSAQVFLLDTADQVDTLPFNAGYRMENGQVIGIEGRDGYMVDVALTLDLLENELTNIMTRRRLELVMVPLVPDVRDPALYLSDVQQLVNSTDGPRLRGYDPYANQYYTWPIPLEEYLSWISASSSGLTLREEAFKPYVGLLNESLNEPGEDLRYLAPDETTNLLRRAIQEGQADLNLRVRYRDTVYTVQSGDTGFAVSRKTGIPFLLIEEANPGADLATLSPGQQLRIPTRDVTMLEQPVPEKRIIVDLDEQYLVAYENNQVVFEWSVSSGLSNAPTSPGIYQILVHDEVAYGGSINYCDDVRLVCGQWEMNWFMGIYEVIPGLVNGFHGSVLLPNGNILGDGAVGSPATFGCIMSPDEQAKLLYDWAEVGTIVEIISFEYAPYSDLAKNTRERLAQADI